MRDQTEENQLFGFRSEIFQWEDEREPKLINLFQHR